jgi:hypothetical protein
VAAGWVPADLEPLHRVIEVGGRLGWDGVMVGMTLAQVEAVVGEDLPAPAAEAQVLCPDHRLEVRVDGQPLHLDFSGTGGAALLHAITVPLPVERGGAFDTGTVVETLRSTLDLAFVPSVHAPAMTEGEAEKPLYRTPHGDLVFVNPEEGVVLGQVCVD